MVILSMWLPSFLYSVGGILLLIYGAERFIAGATAISVYAKLSPLVIGMVVIGFSTSTPELLVSTIAGLDGQIDLSFGNIMGSNITNIALALALPALLGRVVVTKRILTRELPTLIAITAFSLLIFWDGVFTRVEGILFWILFLIIMYISVTEARTSYKAEEQSVVSDKKIPTKFMASLFLVIGLVLLFTGSKLLIVGATDIARALGVSELIIGLTIVAIGTSLPEIASSCMAVLRGETDIAFGNVIGSNIFNLLAILGTVGILSPGEVGETVIHRDGSIMLAFAILLYILSFGKSASIGRSKALTILILYLGYIGYLIFIEMG